MGFFSHNNNSVSRPGGNDVTNGNDEFSASRHNRFLFSDHWHPWEIDGLGGNDTLTGGEKDDTIGGGLGNDLIYGEGGDDDIYGGEIPEFFPSIDNQGNDTVHGGDGDDRLTTHGGDDQLFGGNGEDQLISFGGNDYLDGGNGDDHLSGDDGRDSLLGGNGNDYLSGRDGWDNLNGGAGNDTLNGGSSGYDTLTGGSGADVFVLGVNTRVEGYTDITPDIYYQGSGYALIVDFNYMETDKIQVGGNISDYTVEDVNFGYGTSALDKAIYYSGDLIAVVQDRSGLDVMPVYDFINPTFQIAG